MAVDDRLKPYENEQTPVDSIGTKNLRVGDFGGKARLVRFQREALNRFCI